MKQARRAVVSAAAFLLAIVGVAGPGIADAEALDRVVDVHIAAQKLADALIALARQSGLQIMTAAGDLESLQSPAVDGRMTVRAALAALLRTTTLQYREVGARSVAVQRSASNSSRSQSDGQGAAPTDQGLASSAAVRDAPTAPRSRTHERGNMTPESAFQTTAADQRLQEIIVTAAKLAIDVMHAPVSVTAINGDSMQLSEIRQMTDLQFSVPGLSIANNVGNVYLNIRGIGQTFGSPNVAQGVPVYRDSLLVPTSIGDEPLWDIANVQVLRGPQGTLVGANSTGGAMFINTVNAVLAQHASGYLQLQGGEYHHLLSQGAINLPIASRLAARVGFYVERRDSFSTNLTPASLSPSGGMAPPNRSEPGDLNMLALRGSLLWKPTDRMQLLGRVDYFQNRTGYAAEKPIPIGSTQANGVITTCPAPGSYFGSNLANWRSVPAACGFAPFAPAAPYQIGYATNDTLLDEQIWRESLEARFELYEQGPSLRLLAGGSYNTPLIDGENTASSNFTGGANSTTHEHTLTYEADLLSASSSPIQWVFGGFYWIDASSFNYAQINYSGGAFGTGPGYSQPTGGLYLNGSNSRKNYSLFSNSSYPLNARWKLEAGLRETWDQNSNPFHPCSATTGGANCVNGDANAFHYLSPDPANPWGELLLSGGGFPNLGEEHDSFLTWKIALDFNLSPQSYLYAEVATGGKSGGIRTNVLGDNFQPEKDADFELGWKATLLDGHASVQLDGFYTDYTDMQIRAIDTQSGQASIFNAGASQVSGIELSAQGQLAAWSIAATASYVASQFSIGDIVNQDICNLYLPCGSSRAVQCPPGVPNGPLVGGGSCFNYQSGGLYVDGRFYPWLEHVDGLQLPNSPSFQGNLSIAYRWQPACACTVTPRLDLSYQGRQYSQIYDTPLDDYPRRLNLNFKLGYARSGWLVEGFVTNLTNALYPVAQNDTNAQLFDSPRQVQLRVTRQF